MEQEKNNIGVIVARFQVDKLTIGHKQIIDQVVNSHNKVIIFLGVARVQFTANNPLEFTVRKMMIEKDYPNVQIIPLSDLGNDDKWSKVLDERIREVYPHGEVVLYGSRDSFIPHYKGKFSTAELAPTHVISGTVTRKQISDEVLASEDFRKGIIYACNNGYPKGYPTVDIAPTQDISGVPHVLLCKKPIEDNFRFIGGFFDPEQDNSLINTAHREFLEESTNGEVKDLEHICNIVVDDWRYRGEKDKILTTLYTGEYKKGDLIPNDDISELKWFPIDDKLTDLIHPVHLNICIDFLNYINSKK